MYKYLLALIILTSFRVSAMEAGEYWYVISQRCELLGPTDEAERDAITPALVLFEIVPAGISDYYFKVNTKVLSNYTDEGRDYLEDLSSIQAYTTGKSNTAANESVHDFMLQREAIDRTELVKRLSSFSQVPSDVGYYYKHILKLSDNNAKLKAVTRARLIDTGANNRLYLDSYQSEYYLLNDEGKPQNDAFIIVDHKKALTAALHTEDSPWKLSLKNGVCGEKPNFGEPALN